MRPNMLGRVFINTIRRSYSRERPVNTRLKTLSNRPWHGDFVPLPDLTQTWAARAIGYLANTKKRFV
jgi:hypothetical protein